MFCFVFFFSIKANYYSKHGEKSFQEMNKVSDEADGKRKRVIVTPGCRSALWVTSSCCLDT